MTSSLDFPMPIITHTHTKYYKSPLYVPHMLVQTCDLYQYKYIAGISKLFCDYHESYKFDSMYE